MPQLLGYICIYCIQFLRKNAINACHNVTQKCAQLCFNEAKQEIVIAFIHKVMHAITQST